MAQFIEYSKTKLAKDLVKGDYIVLMTNNDQDPETRFVVFSNFQNSRTTGNGKQTMICAIAIEGPKLGQTKQWLSDLNDEYEMYQLPPLEK